MKIKNNLTGKGVLVVIGAMVSFFCVLVPPAPAFFEDELEEEGEDEDFLMEESLDKESDREEAQRARQTKLQMNKWLKQLDSLKGSRKEAPLLNVISRILNVDPDNVQALNTLGVFYLQSGKEQLAKIIFTRALKKHPKNSSLHGNMAVIALKEGKKEEAIEAFQKSLSYRYSNYAAAAHLGTLYMRAYEYDSAVDPLSLAYSRAKEYLSVSHHEVMKTGNNYAVALAWAGSFRKSAAIFRELIENNPKVVELLLNYAILLGRDMRNTADAYQFLKKADLLDRSGRYAKKIKAIRRYLKTRRADKQGNSHFSRIVERG